MNLREDIRVELVTSLNSMYDLIKTSKRKDLMSYYYSVVLMLERMLTDEQLTVTLAD